MRILLTGATGFIGSHLCQRLAQDGHEIRFLSRNPAKAKGLPEAAVGFRWGGHYEAPPSQAFEGVDAVINLAGESVAGRFTSEHKQKVFDSRVHGTQRLIEGIRDSSAKPSLLISASAVGFYGERGDERLEEDSAPGEGFLADVCVNWEKTATQATALGMNVTTVRMGIVLGRDGGTLKAMLPAFKAGVAGKLGNGKSWMPWIHIDDVVGIFVHALQRSGSGVYNATAPQPVRNKEFTKTLGKVLHRPTFFTAPAVMLRTALGELADVILMSDRVYPMASLKEDYAFKYPELEPALREILGKPA